MIARDQNAQMVNAYQVTGATPSAMSNSVAIFFSSRGIQICTSATVKAVEGRPHLSCSDVLPFVCSECFYLLATPCALGLVHSSTLPHNGGVALNCTTDLWRPSKLRYTPNHKTVKDMDAEPGVCVPPSKVCLFLAFSISTGDP